MMKMTRILLGAVALCAATLAAQADQAAQLDNASAISPMQARLDQLQNIIVTEEKAPASDVAPAAPEVQAVLNAASTDEATATSGE